MVRQLRIGRAKNGLILANGGVMTYQHVVCLSSQHRKDSSPYPDQNPLPDVISDTPVPHIDNLAEGEALIEVCISFTSCTLDTSLPADFLPLPSSVSRPADQPLTSSRHTQSNLTETERHCVLMWLVG